MFDEDRGGLHDGELRRADQLPRRLRQRRVQRDHVRGGQQLVERDHVDTVGTAEVHVGIRLVREQPAAEPAQTLGHLAADATEPDDADGRAGQVAREDVRTPAPVADGTVAGPEPPEAREHQCEREICDAVGVGVGCERDRDTPRGRRLDVDRVVADAAARDQAEARKQVERRCVVALATRQHSPGAGEPVGEHASVPDVVEVVTRDELERPLDRLEVHAAQTGDLRDEDDPGPGRAPQSGRDSIRSAAARRRSTESEADRRRCSRAPATSRPRSGRPARTRRPPR